MELFYYFILKKPIFGGSKHPEKIPKITKINRSIWPKNSRLTDGNEGEGPFDSLYELKKNSLILAGIKLQKHRQRVLKPSNISEVSELVFTGKDDSYSNDFMNAFSHIIVGKITNSKVKGVHFYNPNTTKILEKTRVDYRTKCYSARIETLNRHTGKWIEKEKESNFFPDEWSTNKLFHEFNYAYLNRIKVRGNVYHSETTDKIKVQFIIDQENKIITCYPIIDNFANS